MGKHSSDIFMYLLFFVMILVCGLMCFNAYVSHHSWQAGLAAPGDSAEWQVRFSALEARLGDVYETLAVIVTIQVALLIFQFVNYRNTVKNEVEAVMEEKLKVFEQQFNNMAQEQKDFLTQSKEELPALVIEAFDVLNRKKPDSDADERPQL